MKRVYADKMLFTGVIISYICFFISTMMKNDFLICLFSPLTGAFIGTTILACLSRMGRYWVPSFLLSLGIFSYMVADIFQFVGRYILHSDIFEDLVTFIFLLPNYFFGTSFAIYFIQKLKGRQFYQFLINTFTLTVVGFVAFRRGLIFLGSYSTLDTSELVRVYLYFVINFFILIMIWHMSVMIARKTGFKGTNTMILGILVYILFDIPYTYLQAVGKDPENIYTNLVYMLCMILMAHGVFHQVYHQHVFSLKVYEYTERSVHKSRIMVLLGISVSVALRIAGVIEQSESLYLILVLLAYLITTATFHNGALNEQLLKQQDILTGLYNRRYSSTAMNESIKKAIENNNKFAVFCVDLNSFKPINDTYGHDMGDRVLKEFGSRMLALPQDYTSFRTGGDEFMIIKDGIKGAGDLKDTALLLQKLFHSPIKLETYIFSLSGSIGASVYPDDSEEPDLLMRYADAAMYAVKHSFNKDDYRIFDISLVEKVEKHKALEDRLKRADPGKDFVLHYQPRFDARTGNITAVEVFPRLLGEDEYTAADILPIAEEVGLMNRLGNWIIETSLAQIKRWADKYGEDIAISINLSPLQLLDQDFLGNLEAVVNANKISTSKIFLDVCNDVIMGASITAKETLWTLNNSGYKLSLNDFGGDDINLSHILSCGFTAIHLSPSLIKRADDEKNANILLKTIIGLARNLEIEAYAVGIETKEQADKLKSMGIDGMQGFYFGKPTDAEDFEEKYLKRT